MVKILPILGISNRNSHINGLKAEDDQPNLIKTIQGRLEGRAGRGRLGPNGMECHLVSLSFISHVNEISVKQMASHEMWAKKTH